jgi:hypothetical protein
MSTYPTPTPKMAAPQTPIDDLAAANAAVDNNGGRAEHQALRLLVKQLAGYVQMSSAGDEDKKKAGQMLKGRTWDAKLMMA